MVMLSGAFVCGTAACHDEEGPVGTSGTATSGGPGGGPTGSASQASSGGSSSAGGAGETETLYPDQPPLPGHPACVVEITRNIPVASAAHVPLCTSVTYSTNPPSGGPHWPAWPAFATYVAPIPREMLVHGLEHGAIGMLHHCPGCDAEVRAAFEDVAADHGLDQLCVPAGSTGRFVIAPDPALDHPVALAAWGATYVATCLDAASLLAFVEEHYARGPENTCARGRDPASVTCD